MSYEYTHGGRRFTIEPAVMEDAIFITAQHTGDPLNGMWIPNAEVPTMALELLKAAGQESVIVPKAYEEVEQKGGEITCGSGPEKAYGAVSQNPNWLYNKAANYVALAQWIEGAAAREAAEKAEAEAAEKKLQERRDAVSASLGMVYYIKLVPGAQRAVDRIIELEDKLDGASRD